MPEYPCDFAVCRHSLGEEMAILSLFLPFLHPILGLVAQSPFGEPSLPFLCPLSGSVLCPRVGVGAYNSGYIPLSTVIASEMNMWPKLNQGATALGLQRLLYETHVSKAYFS